MGFSNKLAFEIVIVFAAMVSVSPLGKDIELFLQRQRDPGAPLVMELYVALQRQVVYHLF